MIHRILLLIWALGFLSGMAIAEAPGVIHADAKAAAKLVTEPGVIVLDVRTPKEFAQGHIAKARNIDFNASTFESALSKLDRGTPYVVHCASGKRSTAALATFQRLGFTKVTHLDGGFKAWQAAGLPVAK